MERVTDLADPHRCKASMGTGQCMGVALAGSDYCLVHAGSYRAPEKGMRGYLLARADDRAKLAAFAESDNIKSLREEIALTRIMVQERWNSAKSDAERLVMFGAVRPDIQALEKLVKTCNQMEERLGTLLSKPTLSRVGQQICQVLVNRLAGIPNYEQVVDILLSDISGVIQQAKNDDAAVRALSPPSES